MITCVISGNIVIWLNHTVVDLTEDLIHTDIYYCRFNLSLTTHEKRRKSSHSLYYSGASVQWSIQIFALAPNFSSGRIISGEITKEASHFSPRMYTKTTMQLNATDCNVDAEGARQYKQPFHLSGSLSHEMLMQKKIVFNGALSGREADLTHCMHYAEPNHWLLRDWW